MSKNTKNIVSMLASDTNIILITAEAEMLDMKIDGPHDTTAIAEYLTPKLDGKSIIPIDLADYLEISKAILQPDREDGIMITHVVDGQEVQGIFYPQKVSVSVEHEGKQVVIPDVENLSKHADRAVAENSPAVRNFLRRLAPVVAERLHSAEDLMKFIKVSELPLTNDGRIIGYKKVNQNDKGMFVDVHSGNIDQQVGSHVWMDVSGVDPDRNQSCSHGLHVANLGYLNGFSGSHILIVLVDPANFIAVPHNDVNKCRVCAYDVIGVMDRNSKALLDSGSFVTGEQTFESLISDAVAGNHVVPFEAVQVGVKKVLSRVPIKGREIPAQVLEQAEPETKPSGKSLSTDIPAPAKAKKDIVTMAKDQKKTTAGVFPWESAPKDVLSAFEDLRLEKGSKAAIAAMNNTSSRSLTRWQEKYGYEAYVKFKESSLTVSERARMMFNQGAFEALAAFRRAKKKGWETLGFSRTEVNQIEKALAS